MERVDKNRSHSCINLGMPFLTQCSKKVKSELKVFCMKEVKRKP